MGVINVVVNVWRVEAVVAIVAAVAVVVVIVVVGVVVVVVAIDLVIDDVAADKRASMLLAGSEEKISRRHRWWPCCPQVVHIVDVSTSPSDLFLDSSVARESTEIGASSGSESSCGC